MSISREVLSNYISVQTKRNFAVESGHYDSVFWIGNSGMRVYYDSDHGKYTLHQVLRMSQKVI